MTMEWRARVDREFCIPDGMERIPPPVPNLSAPKPDGTWHYHSEDLLPAVYRSDREACR